MKKLIFVLFLFLFLIGCVSDKKVPPSLEIEDAVCFVDEDCAPAQCCHATSCVPKADTPNCEGTFCTEECRSGSIDCGGACLCQAGNCVAKVVE